MDSESESDIPGSGPAPQAFDYFEQIEYYRQFVPPELHEHYHRLLGQNGVPRHIAGTLAYVGTKLSDDWTIPDATEVPATQDGVADYFGTSAVTIRKWVREIEADDSPFSDESLSIRDHLDRCIRDERTADGRADADEQSGDKTKRTAPRRVYYELYHDPSPTLTTRTLIDRIDDYAADTIRGALRSLADDEGVGGGYTGGTDTGGKAKEWWAVARPDTPAYTNETDGGESVRSIVVDIARFCDWETDGGKYYDRKYSVSRRSAMIRKAGQDALTGVSDPLDQRDVFASEYGLDPEDDMTVTATLQLQKSGLRKIRDTVAERQTND